MRIAVAGATGRIGRLTIAEQERAGHQPVPISRSAGVDAYAGTGLDAALPPAGRTSSWSRPGGASSAWTWPAKSCCPAREPG
jgi:hypothetical protein